MLQDDTLDYAAVQQATRKFAQDILAQKKAEQELKTTPYLMDEADLAVLNKGLAEWEQIEAGQYNKSAMAGFDIVRFQDEMNKLASEYGFALEPVQLHMYHNGNCVMSFEGEYEGEGIYLNRGFFISEGNLIVNHSLQKFPSGLQRKGLSKRIMSLLFEQYEKMGVKRVDVHASMQNGAYTWARYGFAVDNPTLAKFAVDNRKAKLTKSEYEDAVQTISQYGESEPFPMWKLAEKPYGKKLLVGNEWMGFVDLTNKEQMEYLHNYIAAAKPLNQSIPKPKLGEKGRSYTTKSIFDKTFIAKTDKELYNENVGGAAISDYEEKMQEKLHSFKMLENMVQLAQEVDVADIIATQSYVDKADIDAMVANFVEGSLPVGYRRNGKVYLNDGHHRVAAQILQGKKKIRMIVVDVPERRFK